MIHGKSVLAVIPARGGSKGILRKNIRMVAGKPLIAWTIEEAQKSQYIDRLILSSDDTEIIETAKRQGCEVPFVRPAELARDDTPGIEPILHALDNLPNFDYVVLLQPTSPLRTVADIDGCIDLCVRKESGACVSVCNVDKSPYWMYHMDGEGKLSPLLNSAELFLRRQDVPRVFALNGAVYVAGCGWLSERRTFITEETVAYVMPSERSADIDGELELLWCEFMLRDNNGRNLIR